MLNGSMSLNVSTIFGYRALPLYHPEDGAFWLALPSEFFADPEVIRSANFFTRKEPQFCISVGLAISLFFLRKILQQSKPDADESKTSPPRPTFLEKLVCFTIGLLLAPVVAVLIVLFVGYRFLVHEYLKRSIGEKYVGLLKGPDVLWALATDEARSAVNVLVIIEGPQRRQASTADDFLRFVRKVAAASLLESRSFPKLFYRRGESKLGYYLWKQSEEGQKVEDYVRNFEITNNSSECISEENLQDAIAECCNSPFPFGDTATWEILVGQKPLSPEGPKLYPLLFRVHHSVGDGVALLRLLLEGLADKVAYENLSAEGKQKIWAESREKDLRELPVIAINDENRTTLSSENVLKNTEPHNKTVSPENEPEVTFSMSNNIISFRKKSQPDLEVNIEDVEEKVRKSSLGKLRNSFRFLRHNPVRANPVQQTTFLKHEATTKESAMTYSPIKGLGNTTVRTKLSAMRFLTRSITSMRETSKLKNTCVVLPMPRKQEHSSSQSLSEFSTTQKEPAISPQTTSLERQISRFNYDNESVNSHKKLENYEAEIPLEENLSITPMFEKCKSSKIETMGGHLDNELNKKSSRLGEKQESTYMRDVVLNAVVAVVVCVVCIKNSLKASFLEISTMTEKIWNFIFIVPYMLFDQAFGKTNDNILFGKPLSGQKVVSWITEKEGLIADELLKSKIRKIREKMGGGLKFSDVLMACVSRSLKNHYNRLGGPIPNTVKVVLPARVSYDDLGRGLETTALYKTPHFSAKVTRLYSSRRAMKAPFKWENISLNSSTESEPEEKRLEKASIVHTAMTSPSKILYKAELENKFTVALLKLPVESTASKTRSRKDDLMFIQEVQAQCRKLRNAPDYLANYWLLRWVAHLFPIFLVRPFLGGGPCSLVLSNLPGPEDPVYLSGRCIRNIVFWVPNRGLNGLGIGMLSYCGRFSMGVIADKALIAEKEEAREIIGGIFEEVDRLYNNCKQPIP